MTATTGEHLRVSPATPSWRRLSALTCVLLIGWAVLIPPGHHAHWWHYLVAGLVLIGFLGSWHGQHLSTIAHRWAPMAWNNRQRRKHGLGTRRTPTSSAASDEASPRTDPGCHLRDRITIHLRPHPHSLTTVDDHADQLPWQFALAWLDRYGVRADTLTCYAVTKTPPASSLRTSVAPLVTADTPQYRETYLTYSLSADSNVTALTARGTTIAVPDQDRDKLDRRPSLTEITAQRLVAEFRERGWLANVCDTDPPPFVDPTAVVRRECWTATEYPDGYRTVYALDPRRLATAMRSLAQLTTRSTWVAVTVNAQRQRTATVQACAGVLTTTRTPLHNPAALAGLHGMHHRAGKALTFTGLHGPDRDALPTAPLDQTNLNTLRWPTTASGVPMGRNRQGHAVYLGLNSNEPVRITVIGSPQFHVGIVARLALSGLPIGVYAYSPPLWTELARNAAPDQIRWAPTHLPPGGIIVRDSDTSESPPNAMFTVTLRQPQTSPAPTTPIIIAQDLNQPALFTIRTPRSTHEEWLATQLPTPQP